MDIKMQVQQSEDKAHLITRIASKYSNCMVVDLVEKTYYRCDFGKARTNLDDYCEMGAYAEWLQVFVETQIELTQQSRIRDFLSVSNFQHSLNEVHSHISLSYRNRTLPAHEAWKKLQVILLESDGMGIPKRVAITQETLSSLLCSNENRFFNSRLYGVIQFGVNIRSPQRLYDFSYFNVNEKAAEILGYGFDEFYDGVKNKRIDFVTPSDIIIFRDMISSFQYVGDRTDFHLHLINRNGGIVYIGGEAELCCNADGLNFVQMIFIDETSKASQLSEVEELKRNIRELTDTIPCGLHRSLLVGKNSTGYISPNFTKITGYDLIELQEKFDGVFQRLLATPEDVSAYNSAYSRALTTGEKVEVDLRMKHKDGSIIMVRDWLSVVHDKIDRLWLYGAMIEYTDEKKTQNRASLYQSIADYHKKSDETIQKLCEYACPKSGGEPISVQELTDYLSELTGCSTILFVMNDEKSQTEAECSCILKDDPAGPPVSLRYEAMRQHYGEAGEMGCRVVASPMILKSFMKQEFFSQALNPELKQCVIMPVSYQNGRLHYFFQLRNPPEWVMHDTIPRAICQALRLCYTIVKSAGN